MRFGLEVAEGVVGDELAGPAHLVHDLVAGVDAKSAPDTFELRAVADIDADRASGHALPAIDAIAAAFPALALLMRPARLAPEAPVGDEQGIRVEHGALDARPRAHIDANLLAGEPAQKISEGGKDADEDVGHGCRGAVPELGGQRRRVAEIEDEGKAGRKGDQKPGEMRARHAPGFVERPGRLAELDAGVAVALPEALGQDHEVGPHRLRAGIAAPDAARQRGDEKQRQRRKHQNAGDVVEFLRPDFEPEEIQPLMGEIEQEGLIGQAGAAVQPDPRQAERDGQRHDHDRPFDVAELPPDKLRVDGLARPVKRVAIFKFRGSRVELGRARRGFFGSRRYGWHLGHNMLQSQGIGGKGSPDILSAGSRKGSGESFLCRVLTALADFSNSAAGRMDTLVVLKASSVPAGRGREAPQARLSRIGRSGSGRRAPARAEAAELPVPVPRREIGFLLVRAHSGPLSSEGTLR